MTAPVARRYDAYKASEAEWLGEVPNAWNVVRTKELFAERNQRSLSGEETLLTVSHITGVTPRSEKNVNMFMAETMEGYNVCHEGDLIINTMWAWMGALGTSPYNGICSPSYGVYAPRKSVPYCARYYDYLFRTPNAVIEMTRFSKGIVSSRLRLYSDKFFQIAVPLPDLATQQAIAAYLDAKTAQIDRKIDLLAQKAAKYRQLKQSLINEAVTRGLDKSVPMKDSGVEWIGDIPFHWNVSAIKRLSRNPVNCVQTGPFGAQLHADDYVDEGIPLILIRNVRDLQIDDSDIPRISPAEAERLSMYRLKLSDVVFSRVGSIGRVAPITEREVGWLISGQMLRLRTDNPQLDANYLILALSSDVITRYLKLHSLGSTRESINTEILRECMLPVPSLFEQQAIVAYLDIRTDQINRIVEKFDNQIERLKELRKALINDVVTGKLRVA